MASKNKIYVVETAPNSRRFFDNWNECRRFVHGKPYRYAGGADRAAAIAKLEGKGKQRKKSKGPAVGICSDAGTHGNPGPCEYQVADLQGRRLDHKHLGVHSNNFAELAGIGAMIQYAIRHRESELWTDSKVCLGWIETGRIGKGVRERDLIVRMVGKIRSLLKSHPHLRLRKWKTSTWGQIPADFGRK